MRVRPGREAYESLARLTSSSRWPRMTSRCSRPPPTCSAARTTASVLERAHHAYAEAGEPRPAARCAFWIGINLALRGEMGPATGWLGRAQRLLERERASASSRATCCCRSPSSTRRAATSRARSATAAAAAEIGERFGDGTSSRSPCTRRATFLAKGGRVERGARPAGRGDGRGHRGRALTDRHGHRLLRRDPRLRGRSTSCAARREWTARSDALVRAAARPARVHRPLPRAPRAAHAAARRLAGGARGGAARRAAVRARR